MALIDKKDIRVDAPDERDGIKIDKGAVITQDELEKNFDLFTKVFDQFKWYPDLFIDLITPKESKFKLLPYQRIFLRGCMRFRYNYVCACRAFSKSFLSVLAEYLRCILFPGSKVFICSPGKEQSIKIAIEKITEIWDLFPILEKEIISKNFQTANVRLVFRNGSVFDIVSASDAQRGGRRHSGIIDEVRDHDGDSLNKIVLP